MLEDIIIKGAESLGIALDGDAVHKFRIFYDILNERSRVMNLTAIKGEQDAANLHFLDSAAVLKFADFKNKSVIDIGSGAGFPGLPIKIAEPSAAVTMVDATQKKTDFIWEILEALELDGDALCGRAEQLGLDPDMRGAFDIAVSRAVARLNVLAELCMPFVRVGGVFIAMKSDASEDEVTEAGRAVNILGGKIESVEKYYIPQTDIPRRAVIIRKMRETPAEYPRRFAKIKKAPL